MPYVTVVLSSGLGNRFFQVAAMLGYAERHGHTPVFVEAFIGDNPSHPGPYGILDLFPSIPILRESVEWDTIKEVEEFTYRPFPSCTGHVRLLGSFQSHLYFPTSPVPCPPLLLPKRVAADTYFLHVRRGDYLHPLCTHHRVSLDAYWERCLSLIPVTDATQFLVCSEDMDWCKAELPSRLSSVAPQQWRFLPPCDDAATLTAMIGCEAGGLCANSSFSWWAAYWIQNTAKRVFMPGTWGHPPMPVARDLWPPWAIRVPT
jgi:hypothetical protein